MVPQCIGSYIMKIHEIINEDWNKVNKQDKTDGLSKKAVKAYRRENPGSKLQTAVTTKPSKLKPGSKAAKRRKSFCARMSGNKGPMKKPNGKPTPKALALRRWNCESVEEMRQLIEIAERVINKEKNRIGGEDYDPNEPPPGPEFKPTMPKGTVKVDVSDVYDWYKLGQHISNLKGLGKHDFGKGPPSTIISFGSEEEEHEYIKALKKTGLDTTDIDPKAHEKKKGQKTDPTYNVGENFADGKNPQDKGDSKRHGINTKASVSSLRKTAKQGGRKGQLAHWLANMKAGKAKKNES
jgi:hypothetical protein